MKKIIYSTFYLLLLSIAIIGCKKDDVDPVNNPSTPTPTSPSGNPLYSGVTISTSIGGIITDDNGNPISNADVMVGTSSTSTNSDGIFYLQGVSVDESRAFVKVEKSGYFTGSRAFIPEAGAISQVRIQLLPKTIVGSIDNSIGGTVSVTGGATLTFEPGDVSLENGGAYSGLVIVNAYYLDPTLDETNDRMPGDLTAVNEAGEAVSLVTYGMIAVELTGSAGEALNVASGESVGISIPITSQQSSSAPATIPLWYFNESEGNWEEEGQAVANGSSYVGEVSHFSFWNCDIPRQFMVLDLTLECDGNPLQNTVVKISSVTSGSRTGVTNSFGSVAGIVPANETLTLEVLDECGQVIYSQTVVTNSNNLSLGVIQSCASTTNYIGVSGNVVDCSNNPVSNGYLILNQGSLNQILYLDQNGQFNGAMFTCTGGNINLTAVDLTNQSTGSVTQSISTGSPVNVGTITTCNTIDEFIYFTIDGVATDCIETGSNEIYSNVAIDSISINGYNNIAPNTGNITINLLQPVSLGTNNVDFFYAQNSSGWFWPTSQSVSVNITALDQNSGGYIEGTINGTFSTSQGGPYTISGNFRTKNE